MAGHYATQDADTTITRHLPPSEDDSTQDVSMSFVIPPQADASNLLDQDSDDFFAGPGLVTLSTPVLPRHLMNTNTLRKVTRTIQTPAVVSGPILERLPDPKLPGGRTELQETHISPHPLPSLSPTKPSKSTGPSAVGATLITDPISPRPSDALRENDPGAKICDGLNSNTAVVLPMISIVTAKATGKQPVIQSTKTSVPSRHSANAQNTQIPRRPSIPAPQKKNNGPAQPRGTTNARPTLETSKPRGEIALDRETTYTQSLVGGGVRKLPKSTLPNSGVGRANGRIDLDPASSNSRSNADCHTPPTGKEHSDLDSVGDPAEGSGAVTQGSVTTVLPPPESIESRFSLASGGAGLIGSSSSVDPPRVVEDHRGAKINEDIAEEERKDNDRLTVSQLSPSKTVGKSRDDSESSELNDTGNPPILAPMPGTSIAVSPMRPSRKRVASPGHESDTEPGSALPDEWEKRCLITESNREGEVRGGEGKEEQQARRRVSYGKKRRALLQPSRKENGVASMRRLRAKAVRESPRARKLRDKVTGRVGVGAGKRRKIGALEDSRGGHATLDACGFPENIGASTTTGVATVEGKGSKRALSGEKTGSTMPYSGDNQQRQGGTINGHAGSGVGGPYFRSTLKRSTVPVEFRFELAARLGTSRGSAAKEKPGPNASRSNREGEDKVAGNLRKRPRLGELRDAKSGVDDFEETPSSSSRLREAKDDHHDQIGSHAGAWKGKACSRSNNSSATSMSRSKRRTPLIVPEGFTFSTEQRAKDRGKFDEAVRVKQKEKERELEEERAAMAVEEERGIKEMRRRAVPKANSVPEWYTTMPKRKAA